ncbi:hypothetical protein ACVIWU_006737 [Bradyrhizobium sp. USDA 4509]
MADNRRIVLLNRLISRSISHAPREHKPPLISGRDLFDIIQKRQRKGFAVEYLGADDDSDDTARLRKGEGHDCFRLSQLRVDTDGSSRFIVMLFEFIDDSQGTFPVVDLETFAGREISGKDMERGASSAHVVVRLPNGEDFDDGNYRCALENVQPITRKAVERFLNRQIRRDGSQVYSVTSIDKKTKRSGSKDYSYHGRFDLVSDLGRSLTQGAGEKLLSQVVFTRRQERVAIGQPTAVNHEEVIADMEVRISGKQAPAEPEERIGWITRLRKKWEDQGYQTKLYFRTVGGGVMGGDIHRDVESATDLMLCPKEYVTLSKPPKRWTERFNPEMVNKLKDILRKEELWQRPG